MLHARTISPIGIALLLCSFNVTVRGCNAIFCSTTPKKQTSRTQHNPRQRFHTPHAYKQEPLRSHRTQPKRTRENRCEDDPTSCPTGVHTGRLGPSSVVQRGGFRQSVDQYRMDERLPGAAMVNVPQLHNAKTRRGEPTGHV